MGRPYIAEDSVGRAFTIGRADRRYDEQIIAACGEKPTFGYRLVTLRLQRKGKLRINHKRELRVMRERGSGRLSNRLLTLKKWHG